MQFDVEQVVHVPLADVEAAYFDPRFLAELGEVPKLSAPTLLEQGERDGKRWQRVRYAFTGDVSAAVRAVVDPAQLTWVEESTLDRAQHRIAFVIKPDRYGGLLDASGAISLSPTSGAGDATVRRMTGDVVVHVPFVGRRVEAVIVDGLREHAEREVEMLERWAAAKAPEAGAGGDCHPPSPGVR